MTKWLKRQHIHSTHARKKPFMVENLCVTTNACPSLKLNKPIQAEDDLI